MSKNIACCKATQVVMVLLFKVIATSGCVDAWQSKVIRAGAGAHFNLPVRTGVKWNEIYHHLPANASAATQVIVCDSPDSAAAAPSAADGLGQLAAQADSFKCTDPGSKLVYDYSFDEPDLVEKFARIPLPEVALSGLGIQRWVFDYTVWSMAVF